MLRTRTLVAVASATVLIGTLLGSPSAHASELRLLSSNAMTNVMADLLPEFERSTGNKITAVFDSTNTVMGRLKAGEDADVIILIRQAVDELASAGKVVQASERDIARTSLGIAVRAGTPKPDISTVEGLKSALMNARAIATSQAGASGVQFRRMLENLGIADVVTPKIKALPGAAELVARGEADIAVLMVSELTAVPGVEIVGPVPREMGYGILLTAALDSRARDPAAGTALIQFLASPSHAPVLIKNGMEAPQSR